MNKTNNTQNSSFKLLDATKIVLGHSIHHTEMSHAEALIVNQTHPVYIFAQCKEIAVRRMVPVDYAHLRKDCFIAHMMSSKVLSDHEVKTSSSEKKPSTAEKPPTPPPRHVPADISSVVLTSEPSPIPTPFQPTIYPVEKSGVLTPNVNLSTQSQQAMHNVVEHVSTIADKFKDGISSHGKSIENATKNLSEAFEKQVQKFTAFKDHIVQKAEALVSDVKTIETVTTFVGRIIALIAGVYGIVHAKDLVTKGIIATLTITALGISSIPGIVEKLVKSVKSLFNYFKCKDTSLDKASKEFVKEVEQNSSGFSPQMLFELSSSKDEARSSLTTFFDVVKSVFIPLDKQQQKSVIDDARLIESYVKLIKIGKDLLSSVISVVNTAFEYLYHVVNGVPYNMPPMMTDTAKRLLEGSEYLRNHFSESSLAGDFKMQQQIQFLYGLSCNFEEAMFTERMNPQAMNPVREAIKDIKACYSTLCTFYKATKRAQPAAILLYGEAGVNKSDAVKLFEKAIRAQYPDLIDKPNLSVSVKDNKHWEGYNGQLICILDDILQLQQVTERAVEALRIIRIINTDPFILEYASLEKKGKSLFSSPIVIATTNVDWMKHVDCGLYSEMALKRRFELVVHVNSGPGKDWENLSGYSLAWYRYDYVKRKHVFRGAGSMNDLIPEFLSYVDERLMQSAGEQAKEEKYRDPKQIAELFKGLEIKPRQMPKVFKEAMSTKDESSNPLKKPPSPTTSTFAPQMMMSATGEVNSFNPYAPFVQSAAELAQSRQVNLQSLENSLAKTLPNAYPAFKSFSENMIGYLHDQPNWDTDPEFESFRSAFIEDNLLYGLTNPIKTVRSLSEAELWMKSFLEQQVKPATIMTLKGIGAALGVLVAIFGIMAAAYGIYNLFTKEEKNPHISYYTGEPVPGGKSKNYQRPKPNWEKINIPRTTAHSGSSDPQSDEIVNNVVAPNLAEVLVHHESGADGQLQALFLKGRDFVTALHLTSDIKNRICTGLTFIFSPTEKYTVSLDDIDCWGDKNNDRLYGRILNLQFPMKKDITDHLIKNSEVGDNLTLAVTLVTRHQGNKTERIAVNGRKRTDTVSYKTTFGDKFQVVCPYEWRIDCHEGNSGGAYVVRNSRMQHKLVGLHAAGDKTYGLMTPLTYEDVAEFMGYHSQMKTSSNLVPEGCSLDAVVPKTFWHRIPDETEIRPTPDNIRNCIQTPIKAPAALKAVGEKSPLFNAIHSYSPNEYFSKAPYDKQVLDSIIDLFKTDIVRPNPRNRPLSLIEALNTPLDMPHRTALVIDTSCGWPANVRPGRGPGKSDFVKPVKECVELIAKGQDVEHYSHWIALSKTYPHLSTDECKLPTPALVAELHAYFQNVINGRDAKDDALIYCDFLKDELRTLKKVEDCNTRIVSAAPVVIVVAYRMMFSGYMEAQLEDPTHSYCSGGMNPISSEYHAFISNHADMSPDRNPPSYDLDGEKFDKNTTTWQGEAREEIILGKEGFFDRSRPIVEEDFESEFAYLFPHLRKILRAILWDCMSNRHLVVKGHIIRVPNRDPSGAPDTMEKNSMFNTIWNLGATGSSMKEKLGYYDIRWIWKNLKFGSVGDDTQYTPSQELAAFHTFARHVRYMRLWGLNVTDAEKRKLHIDGDNAFVINDDGSMTPYDRKLMDTIFLKRRPVHTGGMIVGRLDLSTIGEIFNWYTSDNLSLELKSRLESAAKEWMLWGRDIYDTNMKIVNDTYIKAGFPQSCCYWSYSYIYTATFHHIATKNGAPQPEYHPHMKPGLDENRAPQAWQYILRQPANYQDPFMFVTPTPPPTEDKKHDLEFDPRDLEPREFKPQMNGSDFIPHLPTDDDKREFLIRNSPFFIPWLSSYTTFPSSIAIIEEAVSYFSKQANAKMYKAIEIAIETFDACEEGEKYYPAWFLDILGNQLVYFFETESIGPETCREHDKYLSELYNIPPQYAICCDLIESPITGKETQLERDAYCKQRSFHSIMPELDEEWKCWLQYGAGKPFLESLPERYIQSHWHGWELHHDEDIQMDSFLCLSHPFVSLSEVKTEFKPHMMTGRPQLGQVMNENHKIACKEYHDKIGTNLPQVDFRIEGPAHMPKIYARLNVPGFDITVGPHPSKSAAEKEMYKHYYNFLSKQIDLEAFQERGPKLNSVHAAEFHDLSIRCRILEETTNSLNDKLKVAISEREQYRKAYEDLQKLRSDVTLDTTNLTAEVNRLKKLIETQNGELNSFRNKLASQKLEIEHLGSANWALTEDLKACQFAVRTFKIHAQKALEETSHFDIESQIPDSDYKPHMSGLGNEDRAPILRTEANSATQLSSFIDQVGVATEKAPVRMSSVHSQANPYPDQGLKPVLSRLYQIDQFQWTSATPSGDLLAEFSFPRDLLKIPTIYRYLTNFRYLRSAVKFQLRINSTPMHYGQLIVCMAPHLPDHPTGVNWKGVAWSKSIYWWSQFEVIEMSVNGQTTVEIEIPFISSESFFDLTTDSTDFNATEGYMGKVMIFCTAPLKTQTASGVASVDVTAWASLVDPEVTGFTYAANHAAPTAVKANVFKPHMATREAEVRSEKGLVTQVAEAAVKLTDTAKSIPIIADVASIANPIAKAVANVANQLGLDKPTTVEVIHRYVQNSQTGFANVKGLDGVERISADPESRNANDNVFCTKDYNQFQNYKLLPALIELGYFDSTYQINDEIWSTPVAPTKCAVESSSKVTYMTYLAELASHFRYWRGSMKFRVAFICSKFISARVVIEWIPNEFDSSLVDGTDSGNFQRMTVDINGDTVVTFCIPYLGNTPYLIVPTPDLFTTNDETQIRCFNGKLTIRVVNPPVVVESTDQSQIYYTIWMAGGEDFQVDRPTGLWQNYHDLASYPIPEAEFRPHMGTLQTVREQFSVTFQSLSPAKMVAIDKLVNADHIGCWTEYMHRYQPMADLTNVFAANSSTPYDVTLSPWDPTSYLDTSWFRRFLKMFQFYRGSMRLKIMVYKSYNSTTLPFLLTTYNQTTDVTNVPESFSFPFMESGVHILQAEHRKTIETEMPFYGVMPLINMLYPREWVDIPQIGFRVSLYGPAISVSLTQQYYVVVATGDDFSCGPPLPPNPLVLDIAKKK